MKKIILVLLICIPYISNGENDVKSNHSIGLNIYGIDYTYEQALTPSISVLGSFGVACYYNYSQIMDSSTSYFSINPTISLGSRYYYNLNKRLKKGKLSENNSGGFLAVKANYFFSPFYESTKTVDATTFQINPHWGMRRVYSDKWIVELYGGVNYDVNIKDLSPSLGLRLAIML